MINLLHFMWLSYTFIIALSGINVLYVKQTPRILQEMFAFGKVHNSMQKKNSILKIIEVPKRWFTHFYIFAGIFIPCITGLVCFKYFNIYTTPLLKDFLTLFSSSSRQNQPTVLPESVIIAGILLDFQVLRRLYECLYVSIYSDSKMNIFHYIVGYTFYFGVGLSLLHDAPGFESGDHHSEVFVSGQWLLWRHVIGILIFIAAFFLQFDSTLSLAALRKRGDKISVGHYMPVGRAFEYVSCPHYFAEIVMYLSVAIVLGGRSYTWWLVCLWTAVNQIITGLVSHRWYIEKFKDYPVKRKAIIPFIL